MIDVMQDDDPTTSEDEDSDEKEEDIESEMNRLGSKQILDRVDCDIDFEVLSDPWIEKIVNYEKSNRS